MLQQFMNNADGIAIMYAYLATIVALIFASWGLVIAIDWIFQKRKEHKNMNYRHWKQNGRYKL